MRRRRIVASGITVAIVLVFATACSGGSSKSSSARTRAAHARAVATARAKKAAQARQVARKRAAVRRRRARTVAIRRRGAQRARTVARRRAVSQGHDLAAIQRGIRRINAAFAVSVERGIKRSVALNYWVAHGVYDPATCAAFEAERGGDVIAETLVVQPGTLRAEPGWSDPVVGRAPNGRVYAVTVDDVQTFVPTGEQRSEVHDLVASVGRDGRARFFFRCS